MTTEESRRESDGWMGILAKACAAIVALGIIAIVSPIRISSASTEMDDGSLYHEVTIR